MSKINPNPEFQNLNEMDIQELQEGKREETVVLEGDPLTTGEMKLIGTRDDLRPVLIKFLQHKSIQTWKSEEVADSILRGERPRPGGHHILVIKADGETLTVQIRLNTPDAAHPGMTRSRQELSAAINEALTEK